MKKFADQIWKRRKHLKMSRDHVADEAKVSTQTLYKWETNQTSPNSDEIFRLSKSLKCTVASFFGESLLPSEVLKNPGAILEAIKELRKTGHLSLEDVLAAAMTEEEPRIRKRSR
jgi:DNA-binding XRE family transcriptional regulator